MNIEQSYFSEKIIDIKKILVSCIDEIDDKYMGAYLQTENATESIKVKNYPPKYINDLLNHKCILLIAESETLTNIGYYFISAKSQIPLDALMSAKITDDQWPKINSALTQLVEADNVYGLPPEYFDSNAYSLNETYKSLSILNNQPGTILTDNNYGLSQPTIREILELTEMLNAQAKSIDFEDSLVSLYDAYPINKTTRLSL